ncbi:MAG: class I SAM-dependent rRNA methyltransferase [Spirochaetota bacterium]
MKKECTIILKKNREKSVLLGHPWIFSGAVKEVRDYSEPGDICCVLSEDGRFLAKGYINKRSSIIVRILTFENIDINTRFIHRIITDALLFRKRIGSINSNAIRLLNGEGDFFPGLIIDRYDRGIVIQALTAGVQRLKGLIVDELKKQLDPAFIYERSATLASSFEGEGFTDGFLYGKIDGPVIIEEMGIRFLVDVKNGQKTGFFLDQRHNRGILGSLARGMEILNCFSYTAAFGIHALMGGAKRVTNIDSSPSAIEGARENLILNRINPESSPMIRADVFDFLREDKNLYDIVVLDPPRFASSKSELKQAARGYKDINMNAMRRLKKGGFLFTFSCSSLITPDLFQKIVFAAASDAGKSVKVVKKLHADVDHPVNLAHREGEYLKGLWLCIA